MGNLIGFSALTSTLTDGKRALRMGLTNAGVIGKRTYVMGARNIAVADADGYGYLCVFNDTSATAFTPSFAFNGLGYDIASSGNSYCLVANTITDITPTQSIAIGNVNLACNAAGDLIVYDATSLVGTPDEEGVVFIGVAPLRVVRKGANWFLGVKA